MERLYVCCMCVCVSKAKRELKARTGWWFIFSAMSFMSLISRTAVFVSVCVCKGADGTMVCVCLPVLTLLEVVADPLLPQDRHLFCAYVSTRTSQYVCTCVSLCVRVCLRLFATYTSVSLCLCMRPLFVCVHVYVCTCVYAHMCVHMCLCVRVCVSVLTHIPWSPGTWRASTRGP